MNGKKVKEIRKHAKFLIVNWLKEMVPVDEADKITEDNYENYIPTEKYIYANRKRMLSAYTLRWVVKRLKKVYNKKKNISKIKMKDIENA